MTKLIVAALAIFFVSDTLAYSRRVCSDVCPLNLAPVCGTDGKTYSNDCLLKNANCRNPSITKQRDGPCPKVCPTVCPYNYAPVCGSDGKTYSNDCGLNIANCNNPSITKRSNGPCRQNGNGYGRK